MAMDLLQSNYGSFYSQLLEFVNEVVNRLASDAPQELQYVTDVPDILPEDDPGFTTGDEDGVINRALIIQQMTMLVVARTRQFVDEGSHEWYDDQANRLNLWLNLISMSLANVQISDEESPEFMEAGIGGINTGFQSYREVNFDNLRALQNVLINGAG